MVATGVVAEIGGLTFSQQQKVLPEGRPVCGSRPRSAYA
jgi:hypothetical protein